jgi:hypothetical protein
MLRSLLSILALALLSLPCSFAGSPAFRVMSVYDYRYPGYPPLTTFGGAIDDAGNSVGLFTSLEIAGTQSFKRFANGRFSAPIIYPAGAGTATFVGGLNNAGLIYGSYSPLAGGFHGFFYDGRYTQYDIAGADETHLFSINDAGDFVGYFHTIGAPLVTGFASINGVVTVLEIPGMTSVLPSAINNLGQMVGQYSDPADPARSHGFFRDADGTFTYPLDYPGSRTSYLSGLNDQQQIVGAWDDSNFTNHGLYLTLPNHFSSYDYVTGGYTVFSRINNKGRISGSTSNHGLIVQLVR